MERTAGTFSAELSPGGELHQNAPVLAVHGEIDLGTALGLRRALLPLLEHRTGPVVVDLSEVGFIDSSGVHVIVETLQRLNLENRRFAIACREEGQVHRLLGLVGLLDIMAVYGSLESAMAGGDDRLRPEAGRIHSRLASQPAPQSPSRLGSADGQAPKASDGRSAEPSDPPAGPVQIVRLPGLSAGRPPQGSSLFPPR